jgi:hypothetical protein
MMRLISTILITGSIIACHPHATTLSEDEKKDIVDTVKKTLDNYYMDIREYGLNAEFKYLDSSADFFWVPPGFQHSISYDSVVALIKQSAAQFSLVDNSFDTLQIIPLSKEIATYTGKLRSSMTDTSGKTSVFYLTETGTLVKRRDGWKLLSGQTTLLNDQ